MAVNGSKTEIVFINYNSNDPFEIALISDTCKVKTSRKSLGIIIDNKTNFKEHAELSVAKAQRNCSPSTSKCTNRWCLSRTTQVYLYRTIIVPQAVFGAPLWYHKNTHQFRRLRNIVIKIFKHGPSPSIEACEALTGIPPIDIYCKSIAIKFAIKIRQNDDLVWDTHLKSISKPRSRANSLESSLKRYSRFMNQETIIEYTNDQIAGFITDQWRRRWKRGFNNSFLTNLTAGVRTFNGFSMICGDSYTANKICEFLIGNCLKLADMKWKFSLCASPMCECDESEETPFHFFFNCKLQSANRPNNCTNLNVFNQDDCVKLTTLILNSKNWTE